MPLGKNQDLTVKGEAIERTYANYQSHKYIVNRRYQRKLIWSLDEKRKFIDSISRGYPVPIILLAEDRQDTSGSLEIIDGMQRLNAVASFIENDFAVEDGYFDLESMAITKAALDEGKLTQKTPSLTEAFAWTLPRINFLSRFMSLLLEKALTRSSEESILEDVNYLDRSYAQQDQPDILLNWFEGLRQKSAGMILIPIYLH